MRNFSSYLTRARLVIITASFLMAAGGLHAQVDLAYFLEQAYVNDPGLTIPDHNRRIAELESERIEAQFSRPTISVSGDLMAAPYFRDNGRIISLTSTPSDQSVGYDINVSNGGLYSAQVNVDYPLFTQGQKEPLLRQQSLEMERQENARNLYQVQLERQVTADYLNALGLQQQRDNLLMIRTKLETQQDLARRLAERGLFRLTDVELLTAQIGAIDLQVASLNIQYRQALQSLMSRAAIRDTGFFRLAPIGLEESEPNEASIFLTPYALDSLGTEIGQEIFETRYLPSVHSYANTGINAVSLNQLYRKVGGSVGIQVSWLIHDGHQQQINAEQVQIQASSIHQQADFLRRQVENNRENYRILLEEARGNMENLDGQLATYTRILDAYRREMASGQVSVMDYLNVWRTYTDLQQQTADMRIQILLLVNELNYWNH